MRLSLFFVEFIFLTRQSRSESPRLSGSWKYNTGRIDSIINALTSDGISVQLKFLEGEGSRDLVRYVCRHDETPTTADFQVAECCCRMGRK